MRRAALAAAACAAVVVPAPATAADVVAKVSAGAGFSLGFAAGPETLTAETTGPVYTLGDGTTHRTTRLLSSRRLSATKTLYTFATDERSRTMRLTVARGHHGVRAAWSAVPADGVDHVVVQLDATRAQHWLGGGEQQSVVDLRGRFDRLKVWNVCGSNAPAPWFLSSAGYGILVDTQSVGGVAFPGAVDGPQYSCEWGTSPCPLASGVDAVQLCERAAQLSYWIFGGSFEEMQRNVTAVVGRPALPSPSEFELLKWRDEVSGAAELLDDVAQLQSRGIPIGWEIVDNPWESCLGSLTFDPTAFPDPAGLVRTLNARGVRLMAWVSPLVDPACGAGSGYRRLVPAGDGLQTIDLTDPSDRAEFERRVTALLALGVAGVKGDRGDEVDLEHVGLSAGPGESLHNAYAVRFAQAVAEAASRAGLAPLPSIFRAGWLGSPSTVTGFWAADQPGDLHGLRSAIRSAATAGLGGYSTWGSDIGGYNSTQLTADVFVRWAQLGAVSPVFEVGGNGPQATFWNFGEPTTSRFRDAATLHYELYPTLYALARAAHATGVPVLRSLAFGYPGDPTAWKRDLELLVGPDLLAAPVDAAGAVVSFPVYLPHGTWVDVFNGRTQTGGRTIARRTTLDDFPLYLRAGAAIGFDLRANDVWSDPWQANELERPGRAGWLYAPAGRTRAAGFAADASRSSVELRVQASESQVLVLGRRRPASVVIDGHRVAARPDLRPVATGWRLQPGSHPGVLLKLKRGSRAVIRWR